MTQAGGQPKPEPPGSDDFHGGDALRPAPGADLLVQVVAGQIAALEAQATALESTMLESFCARTDLTAETIQSLQRVDLLRQSLSDIAAMLSAVAPRLDWAKGRAPSQRDLRDAVKMQESLSGLIDPAPEDETDIGDGIWL